MAQWMMENICLWCFCFLDLDERIIKQQEEEEERKRQRREKKKEKKVSTVRLFITSIWEAITSMHSFHLYCLFILISKYHWLGLYFWVQKEKAAIEEETEIDPDIAAMMGFGSFHSSKNWSYFFFPLMYFQEWASEPRHVIVFWMSYEL